MWKCVLVLPLMLCELYSTAEVAARAHIIQDDGITRSQQTTGALSKRSVQKWHHAALSFFAIQFMSVPSFGYHDVVFLSFFKIIYGCRFFSVLFFFLCFYLSTF